MGWLRSDCRKECIPSTRIGMMASWVYVSYRVHSERCQAGVINGKKTLALLQPALISLCQRNSAACLALCKFSGNLQHRRELPKCDFLGRRYQT
jgi:hypothetical protein